MSRSVEQRVRHRGADGAQAREFLKRLDLEVFLEGFEADPRRLLALEAVRTLEDYKPLDVQAGAMVLELCRQIRHRYADWRYLLDGDGCLMLDAATVLMIMAPTGYHIRKIAARSGSDVSHTSNCHR